MRNFIGFLTAAVLVVACSDDPHPTSPATRSPSGNGQATTQNAPLGQSKPADQVGFTKITTVTATSNWIQPFSGDATIATCPAGTTVISGGHIYNGTTFAATQPALSMNRIEGNGWIVGFVNGGPSPVKFYFTVYAYCAS